MAMDKTFDAAGAEGRIYAAWEESGAFAAGANASRSDSFCIMMPPPNVTGSLHMGHAFNSTLQDILIRWHRMRGFDTLWQPGQDHAGIATQMVVERMLAEQGQPPRREMGREAFLRKVWEWKVASGGAIVNQLKRLGASCDWSRNAFTMSGAPGAPAGEEGNFHDAVIRVFVDMHRKGLIYRGKRLVNWDPHFETAISDLEVENIEVDGHMWHFKYPLADGQSYAYVERDEDGNVVIKEERDYISIATTRPETMLGDGAVAVHPSDARYAPIVGRLCEIPVGPKQSRRQIPIITDEYPDPEFGSGAVKITGAHDFNDYGVAERGGIPMYRLMDTAGAMRVDGADYAACAARAREIAEGAAFTAAQIDALNLVPDDLRGLDRFEARKRVVEQITSEGLAVTVPGEDGAPVPLVERKPIMQPFGDRSKVVVEPMLTDQWFVDTAKIVGPAIEAVRSGETRIMPESDRKVYFHWLESIEPWCISRQLWWGHQIPVWYGPALGADSHLSGKGFDEPWTVCAADDAEAAAAAAQAYGGAGKEVRIVEMDEALGLLRPVAEAADAEAAKAAARDLPFIPLYRDPDVLDTWFSSGLWPIGTLGWPDETPQLARHFPTSVLVTGFDIIFFWVARMMMMQYAVVGEKPFRDVYVHALVRDEKGKKMSKSLGNVIDPIELIEEYGADAVRFTLTSMAAMGRDLKLSTQRVAGYRNFGTKLWNAARFAEMNGAAGGAAAPPRPQAAVNRWILGETAKTRIAVDAALEQYRFNDAANALYAFVWGVVCDWYVEFSKPLLYDGDDAQQRETRETMAWVMDQCLILLHPIMPFVTEEIWGVPGGREGMLVHADWPSFGDELIDAEADRELNWVIALIEEVRSARAQVGVPAGAKLPMLAAGLDKTAQRALERNREMISRLARIDGFEEVGMLPEKGCITVAAEGGSFGLSVAGAVDVAAERARLEKERDKVVKELSSLGGRLNNAKFLQSAPEDVIEETRENLARAQEREQGILAALERMSRIG